MTARKPKAGTLLPPETKLEQLQTLADELGVELAPSPTEQEEDIAERLDAIAQRNDQSFLKVYRFQGFGKSEPYLDKMAINDFDEDALRTRWGPGKYRLKVIDPQTKRVLEAPVIELEKLPGIEVAQPIAGQTPAVVVPQLASNDMQAMFSGLATLISNMGQTIAGAVGNRQSLFEEMRVMKDIIAGGAHAPATNVAAEAAQMMGFFLKGMELARGGTAASALAGASGEPATDNDIIITALREGLPLLRSVLAQPQQPKPQQPQQPKQPALAAPVQQTEAKVETGALPAKTVENVPAAPSPEAQLEHLKNQGRVLVGQASVNSDPYYFVDTVLSFGAPEQVSAMLTPPTWFHELVNYLPEAGPYQDWFEDLREMTLYALSHPTTWRVDLTKEDEEEDTQAKGATVTTAASAA